MEILYALCLQLLGSHGETGIVRKVLLQILSVVFQFIDQMTAQVGFTDRHAAFVVRVRQLRHANIGLDPAFLHRTARWQMVACNRQAQARVARQGKDVLHRSLAKAAFPHDEAAMMVLQRTRHDFRSRSRTGIDQHNDRRTARYISWNSAFGPPTVHIARVATPFGHNLALRQKRIGYDNRLIQYAARVRAQIDYISQRIAAQTLLDARNRSNNVGTRPFGKARYGDNADAVFHFPLHRLQVDNRTRQRDVKWTIATGAENCELNRCARRAAHGLHRFVQGAANNQLAVQMGDEVAGLDACLVGGRILCRRDDLHRFILKRYRKPKAAIFTIDLRP